MWKRIKRFYWKQQLNAIECDMFIFAIEYKDYLIRKEFIEKKISELL